MGSDTMISAHTRAITGTTPVDNTSETARADAVPPVEREGDAFDSASSLHPGDASPDHALGDQPTPDLGGLVISGGRAVESEISTNIVRKEDMLGPFYTPTDFNRRATYPKGTSPEIARRLLAVAEELGLPPGQLTSLESLAQLMGYYQPGKMFDLKLQLTDQDGEPLPAGTKVHVWHANVDTGLGFPGGVYDQRMSAVLDANTLMETASLVRDVQFGRSHQTVDGDGVVEFEVLRPDPYDLGEPDTFRPAHIHVAVELPDGTIIDERVDISKNGLFETQLYFGDDPHNAADDVRFGDMGFDANRVMGFDESGKSAAVRIQVGIQK